ncbi:MAG: hypothetical protein J6036_05070 [Clostridia bacterium]|nr:hypothetical protein [Clostridia bacterium]
MKNALFKIDFDKATGTIMSISNVKDKDEMNWCNIPKFPPMPKPENAGNPANKGNIPNMANIGGWGKPEFIKYDLVKRQYEPGLELKSYKHNTKSATCVFEKYDMRVVSEHFFAENGNLVERFTFKNITEYPIITEYKSLRISIPFFDAYTNADECMIHRCNAHIWCGHNVTFVNALKMGVSDINLGLYLTKGAFDGYSCERGAGRGRFMFNVEPVCLESGEEYVIEWQLFWHTGNEDFEEKIKAFDNYLSIDAVNQTVYSNENIKFKVATALKCKEVSVTCDGKKVPFRRTKDGFSVSVKPAKLGHNRFDITVDGVKTYTEFHVSLPLWELAKKRIDYIVDKQQYRRKGSPLDGAYIPYDTKLDCFVFDHLNPDHNAHRERIGMALLIMQYLRHERNEKFEKSFELFIKFFLREFFDVKTGRVYNGLKQGDDGVERLYNYPWAAVFLAELYRYTKKKEYLKHCKKIMLYYYEKGGYKFYPNAVSPYLIVSAFVEAGLKNDAKELTKAFVKHADTMIEIGTSYPKHEVVYEQTIVCPAVTIILDAYRLTKDEKYLREAEKHLAILERFNGRQPSYHLKEVAIRYWDDYWFGKSRTMGDTFPHYWSSLSANALCRYGKISGKKDYSVRAEEGIRNMLCLFFEDGGASCAYVYGDSQMGKPSNFYDEWANDQDFALYYAVKKEAGEI